MRKILLLLVCCLPAISSFADLVKVGLFSGMNLTAVETLVAEGNYSLILPGSRKEELRTGVVLTFSLRGSVFQLKKNGKPVGNYNQVRIVSLENDGALRINLAGQPEPNQFTYGGHFELAVVKGKIRILNLVDLESYVAAVVESEVGANSSPEFLKVQSVLCRTYCLNHLDRHAAEGFQLCDRVHCQAYKGKSRFNRLAEEAVQATRNKVLVDQKNQLIIAAYHSNCGGQTVSAESVWSQPVGYLLPVPDTFCLNSRHATWSVIMSLKDWKAYLHEKGLLDPHADSLVADSLFEYHPQGRSVNFTMNGKQLALKTIRENWKLNSTWFDIKVSNDSLQFTGRGFGHGIGLCQEGAMKMAEAGRTFGEIIDFYYRDVKLADADALKLWNK
jgi:stage II sporulation protein D